MIFTGNNPGMFDEFKKVMTNEFEMTYIGQMSYFLGVGVKQNKDGIFVSQTKYAEQMLSKFRMKESKRILRYIKCTISYGLFYTHVEDSKLVGYSHSDYGGDLDDGKSTSGYAFHRFSSIFMVIKEATNGCPLNM
ncbi:hypothetical protein POM88_044042 [Heracleum sosnowskyi]|uniref:Reverse transcriptase Ty1/copia-type domain-containing protein n=1 Tax=Heracleum sosnowskyi TaxID=360622 RepID=A0AAD8M514_9APIA|nr:hypothetical protein POM88_044042 [Heracleum sosnowskyi]